MAVNPINILKQVLESVTLTVTIDSVDALGSGSYKLNTKETYYLRTLKQVTIDGVDYQVTDFSINEFITVKALSGDVPVTASSFTIDQPLFVWGNPKMVSAELVKRTQNGTAIWPYLWAVEISNTQRNLDPAAAVTHTPSFNLFLLDSSNKEDWTISQHYDNAVYTLNNYIDSFISLLKSRRDLFDTDSISFTVTNHVNFGDYIVDEGMNELILNDQITGIQLEIDIPFTISTCKDVEITPNCTPSTYQNSDQSFTQEIGSGQTYTAPDIEVSVNTIPQGAFPANTDVDISITGTSSFLLAITGQENSYETGDDGDQFLLGTYDNEILTDFYTLKNDNEWGHKNRFTGDTGGYMDFSTGNFFEADGTPTNKAGAFPNNNLRDYAFRRRWHLNRSGSDNWVTRVANTQTETRGGETG